MGKSLRQTLEGTYFAHFRVSGLSSNGEARDNKKVSIYPTDWIFDGRFQTQLMRHGIDFESHFPDVLHILLCTIYLPVSKSGCATKTS